jgi:uncharacterized membrane protein
MPGKILLILFYFLFPMLVVFLVGKYSLVRKIGAIVICYAVGLFMGNINILPDNIYGLQDILTSITIPLAIPLLLFSENIKKWIKMARTTFLSLVLGLVSAIIMIIIGFLIFKDLIPEAWKISGMLVGVYSGGTPNLAAIQEMLDVDKELYILTHTSDLVIGVILLLFLLSFGQRFFLLFMKPFKHPEIEKNEIVVDDFAEFESYNGMFTKPVLLPLIKAFGITLVIVGIGVGIMQLFEKNNQMIVAILSITTLGILASLVPSINAIKKTFPLGMYFILVFSLVVSSMADLNEMFAQGQSVVLLSILLFIVLAVIGSLMLHSIFSKIFGIDVDNFIITSVALSMSPPFVPVIAGALKNRSIILSGLILGIIGYAIGNYLGVIIALILK